MTRAFGSLLRGDLGEAMRFHPLVIVVALQIVVLLVAVGAKYAGVLEHRRPDRLRHRPLGQPTLDYWMLRIGVLNFVAFVGVWGVRWQLGLLDAIV